MAEYVIKRVAVDRYEVAKFDGDAAPEAVYTVVRGTSRLLCNCAAATFRKKPCRHTEMVEGFLEAGEPVPYSKEM